MKWSTVPILTFFSFSFVLVGRTFYHQLLCQMQVVKEKKIIERSRAKRSNETEDVGYLAILATIKKNLNILNPPPSHPTPKLRSCNAFALSFVRSIN